MSDLFACTIRETVAFYVAKDKLDYAPAFKVRDVKALLDERDALYTALEGTLEAHNQTCIERLQEPPIPEDYPVKAVGPWHHARPAPLLATLIRTAW